MASDETPVNQLSTVTITTDGATRGNPGPGGWAALLQYGARERLIDGEEPAETTNNVMELVAVAAALETLKRPCHVVLRCDSTYVLEGLKQAGDGSPLPKKNRAVWERLRAAAARHTLELIWVKGHAGDPRNERVDAAANAAANRAYTQAAAQRDPDTDAGAWLLALCSAASGRPVGWALHTPQGVQRGSVGAPGVTMPADVFRALIAGLEAAEQLPDAGAATIRVISNWELIIKQQRGEWGVKKADHKPLHLEVLGLRSSFHRVEFEFQPTETVLEYFEDS